MERMVCSSCKEECEEKEVCWSFHYDYGSERGFHNPTPAILSHCCEADIDMEEEDDG